MKKILLVIALTLALNFLAVAGGVGYLVKTGRLNKVKVAEIKKVLFPPPPAPAPAKPDPATQPTLRLDELLAQQSGHSAAEQVEFIQHTFDAQMAQLDRRQRELADLQRQVDLAKEQLAKDRAGVDKEKKAVAAREAQAKTLETDKGFQDSLALYQSMPTKQAKSIFMTLDDPTVLQYLQAMEPRSAARIVKEFKTPEEIARIQRVLEQMRLAQDPANAANAAAAAGTGGANAPTNAPANAPAASAGGK